MPSTPGQPQSLVPPIAAACAGAAAWFSLGSLAVANAGSEIIRLGLLPPLWLLPVLALTFAVVARLSRLSVPAALPLFFSLVLVLPWLPFRVPAAFLIWTGHVTIAVWLSVIIGMLAAHGLHPSRWLTDARRAPRLAAAIACVLYLATGFRLAGLVPGGDEPHYLVITQSLLKDGDLRIENNHAQADYREYFSGRLAPDFLRRGTNGQIYSIHAPGLSALVAPAFALFGYSGVAVFLSIVAAIGSALLWRASYVLTGSTGAAWFGWAAGALTVPFFFQSFAVYPDGVGATLVLFAVMPLLQDAQRIGKGRWFAIGLVLALLPWLHTRFAVLSGALGLVLLLRLLPSPDGRSRVAALLAAPLVSVMAWFGFFRVIYGTFNPSAPYGGNTQGAPENILNGLPALIFDQQFGILAYAPVYGVCFAGLFVMARRRPRLALELLAIAVPYLLVTSMFYMWWAGSVSPARLVVPLLPLLALPGAWLWRHTRHAATRAIATALLLLSMGITLSLVVVEDGRLAYNFRDGYSLAAERLSPLVDLPKGLPSFFRQTSAGATLRGTIWVAVMCGAVLALRAVERRTPPNARAALALATPASMAVAMMIAVTIVWKMDRVQAATADTSQLDLLKRYNPRLRPLGVRFNPFTFESSERTLSAIAISTPTRRPAPPAGTLLIAPGVIPAGEYELRPRNPSSMDGSVRLVIGRLAKPIRTWNLATDLRSGGLTFDLPVNVGSLIVEGDGEAARSGGLVLIPKRLVPAGAKLSHAYARRVERYSRAHAYFFDDGAFPEQPGFWIRGGAESSIAVAPIERGAPLQLFLRNAPVKNSVTIDIDGEPQVLELQPREERVVPLPIAGDRKAAMLRFRTSTGFRPSSVEPGSIDNRFLGVWVELK